MTQAICDITTDEVNVDVVVEPQADTMVEVANRAGGMEQVFHDNTLIGNGNSVDLGVNTDIIATKEYSDEQDTLLRNEINGKLTAIDSQIDAIEEKIPGNASASNQLATKADLKDIDLDGYVKKSGDTVDGDIRFNNAGVRFAADKTDRVRAIISWGMDGLEIQTGVAFADRYYFNSTNFYASSGIKLGISSNPWSIAYIQKLNNGSDISVPAEGGTLARVEDLKDFAKKGDLSGYLPMSGGTITGLVNFNVVGDANNNKALISAQTADGLKALFGAKTDENGILRDVAIIPKLQGDLVSYETILASFIGNINTPVTRIHAKKITGGGITDAITIPAKAGTMARIEDINEAVATKQDKLTAGENITIVDNVISATGGGGGGITEVAHDDTLAGNGTTDSPLGLAETIKSEIAGKQKQLHPGTNVFINSVNPDYDIISVPNMVSSLNGLSGALSLQAGDGIAIDGLKISATGGGGTGTDDYTQLLNKPEINGNVLTGNKTASQLGFATVATSGNYSDLSNKPTINDLTTTAQQNAINSTITSSLVSSYSNHIADTGIHVTAEQKTAWTNKQDSLVSGTNIKTINNNSLLGSGNINIDSLPDQSGNAGKVLTTDGTTASWQEPAGGTKVIFREWE